MAAFSEIIVIPEDMYACVYMELGMARVDDNFFFQQKQTIFEIDLRMIHSLKTQTKYYKLCVYVSYLLFDNCSGTDFFVTSDVDLDSVGDV